MAFGRKFLNGVKQIIQQAKQEAALPYGTICWFNLPSAPAGWAVCDGTQGTPDLIGRYALGSNSKIGTDVAAGLPNITGMISVDNKDSIDYYNVAGSFTKDDPGFGEDVTASARVGDDGNADFAFPIYFNANLSNGIYGNSNTVTPPSVRLLPCMKL